MHLSGRPLAGPGRLRTLWLSSALGALMLSLSVSGTLSSWTQAVVTNDGNTISTGNGGVVLKVAGPGGTSCSSDDADDNDVSCSINLFGNAGSTVGNLRPGETATTAVTLSNEGEVAGSTLAFAPGPCTGSAALCGELKVSMVCTGAATTSVLNRSLDAFAGDDASFVGTLQPLGVTTSLCAFTVTLPLTAPLSTRNQTVSQELTWSLTT